MMKGLNSNIGIIWDHLFNIKSRFWTSRLDPFKALNAIVIACNPVEASTVTSEESLPKCAVPSDLVITRSVIEKAIDNQVIGGRSQVLAGLDALAIMTGPNENGPWKMYKSWNMAPYFTPEAAAFLSRDLRLSHWLVDLPSVDRMMDGGELLCHRAFFGSSKERFITELCYFDPKSSIVMGQQYRLFFHYLPWWILGDVIPTRPILMECDK